MKPITFSNWWFVGLAALALGLPTAPVPAQIATSAPLQMTPAPSAIPGFHPTHEDIGDSLMARGQYQAAIEQYKQATPSAELLNKTGVAYQLLYNTGDAARCYKEALREDPNNPKYLNNMGSVYMSNREYGRAVRSFRRAARLDSTSALYQKNLGTALFADRSYKKGWVAYQAALKLDPQIFDHSTSIRIENPGTIQDRGAMNYYMAKGCMKAGLPERAIEYLRLALNEGFTTPKKVIADTEFDSLHKMPAFLQMMAAQGVYLNGISAHPPVQQ